MGVLKVWQCVPINIISDLLLSRLCFKMQLADMFSHMLGYEMSAREFESVGE